MNHSLSVATRPSGRWRGSKAAVVAAAIALAVAGAALVPAGIANAADPVLLSQGKPATASSVENTDYTPAANAVDGNAGTRWSSTFSDPQWLQVDLGQSSTINRIDLAWEGAYAKAFQIQVSDSGTGGWTSIYSTTTGPGGNQSLSVSGQGRYVRMYGTVRANGYGYSLWEFKVFGTAGSSTTPTPTPTPTTPPGSSDPGYPNQPGPFTQPSVVKVTGGNGSWQLQVDGKPYSVKGFTWGPSFDQADTYMPGLVAMGANTIRTWGTGADTKKLLDSAAAHGIRVINGFWLLPGGGPGSGGCIDYTTDENYKSTTQTDIINQVNTYKTHPGVLMWNVGNESLLGLQNCFSGTKLEDVRNAYAAFVNRVAVAIHAADPNHPVTSTDAWTGAWPYLKRNAPALDLLAVNSYGDVCNIKQTWIDGGYNKPYIVTEGGAPGEWEVSNDANGVPNEPTDVAKAAAYVNSWNCIIGHKNVGLGATFFHYGTEGDFGGVWFNVIPGGNKRLGYYSIAKAWGKTGFSNTPPVISSMSVTENVAAGSTVTVSVKATDPDGDTLKYVPFFNSTYIDGSGGTAFQDGPQPTPGTFQLTAPQTLGVWKAYVWVEDGHGNVGVESRSFRVVAPPVAGTNIAKGKPASASSFQTTVDNYSPGQAVDGNVATRWASEWSDAQWLQVDLGSVQSFTHVQLLWESAYGKAYTVQTSNDGATWSTIKTVTAGDGGADDFDVSGNGRYVRLSLTQRGTAYGYSLFEFGIYR
ncbi:discoidin domain-containing protein [Rathayibacter sp. YIM 133350]|uniref:discoidin domain-containing protein n=1 Tax=Rathayibacter sp. YIM 133350 TaxID=3131992 RepID=UPI00307CFDC5